MISSTSGCCLGSSGLATILGSKLFRSISYARLIPPLRLAARTAFGQQLYPAHPGMAATGASQFQQLRDIQGLDIQRLGHLYHRLVMIDLWTACCQCSLIQGFNDSFLSFLPATRHKRIGLAPMTIRFNQSEEFPAGGTQHCNAFDSSTDQ